MSKFISDSEYQLLHKNCKQYINEYCIWRAKKEDETKSKQPWQFLIRRGLYNPDTATAISLMFLKKIHDELGHMNFQLSGLETGATPLVQAINIVARHRGLNINTFIVRKDIKDGGISNVIEGIPHKNVPILLCDDITISGSSILRASEKLKKRGFTLLNKTFSVVDGSANGHPEQLSKKVTHLSLYSHSEFDVRWNDKLPYWDII